MRHRSAWLSGAYAVVVVAFAIGFHRRPPFDDSYFFKRFALNLLDHGLLAWNVAEGPVYGSTSQLYQLVVAGLTALTRTHTFLAMRLFLVACLVLTCALLLRLTERRDGGLSALLACCAPAMLYTPLSGMETALAFALLGLLLWLVYAERAARVHWTVAPLVVFTVWLTRPDAVLLAAPVLLIERGLRARRWPVREALLLGGLLAASLVAFERYYGTALPLPFYAKQRLLSPYDPHFLAISAGVRRIRVGHFLFVAVPLCAAALGRRDRTNLLLLGVSALFVAYHYFATVEVMGMFGRFYAPCLPLLALASARGLDAQAPAAVRRALAALGVLVLALLAIFSLPGPATETARIGHYVVTGLAGIALVLATFRAEVRARAPGLVLAATCAVALGTSAITSPALRSDDAYLTLHTDKSTVFRGMDVLRGCFGEAIHVYHSEVGVPGLRFARGTVTDLAGLLSPAWLFRARSFDAHCLTQQPEAIFLPHENYRALNEEIQRSRCINQYVRVVAESRSPLYVRRDLAPRYEACRAQVATR